MAKPAVDEEKLKFIKQVILEEAGKLGVRIERIILFGSRARGEARPDSDYDILIVVKGKMSGKNHLRLQSRIRTRLYKLLHSDLDLIIIEQEMFDKRREAWGSVEHTALEEGIIV